MDIAIIGAGAAGLFAAKRLCQQDKHKVHLFEKAEKPGTKLRASGGGKANILNTNIKGVHYNHSGFMDQLLERVNYETIRAEFEGMGLRMRIDEEGRVYPASFFAATVMEVLLEHTHNQPVEHYGCNVEKLRQKGGKWFVNDLDIPFDRVLLCSGSPAGMIAKNQVLYNKYVEALRLKQRPLLPSLVGFRIRHYPHSLFGCRAKAEVSLYHYNELIHKEIGEVNFKEDGVSGIVVLNCSAHYNRLESKKNCSLSLNFLYDDPNLDLHAHLSEFGNLNGILHPKLSKLFNKQPFNPSDFRLEIDEVYDLSNAQVCRGGIDLSELGPNFEIKRHTGLYAIGEMVDIDGVCGGYNLFFAFASAFQATEGILHSHER